MNDKETVIREVREAFGNNEYPGDNYLQGSFEGCEPYEEIEPFKGRQDWQNIDSKLLDAHSGALNFFSEAGLRYFLPAYLMADLHEELQSVDPVFVLVHGFSDLAVNVPTKTQLACLIITNLRKRNLFCPKQLDPHCNAIKNRSKQKQNHHYQQRNGI